jgi:high-affinity iron transporter
MTMRRCLILGCVLALLAWPLGVGAAGLTPAQSAEALRAALVQAQLSLPDDVPAAENALHEAETAYVTGFATAIEAADPGAAERLEAGFGTMAAAVEAANGPQFAAARGQAWTALLAGSYAIMEQALERGDAGTARTWLGVREFRQATRFARPGAEATLAVERLAAGEMTTAAAVQTLRADLFDTYQARLNEALNGLETAQTRGFAMRAAEHAALAEGYFWLLARAYGEQYGAEAQAGMQAQFTALRVGAVAGNPVGEQLAAVRIELNRFRAAPLSPEEQGRRAGQLLRYVGLVPIEYGRGVAGDRVTTALEITEAVTFRNGAEAAFADLRSDLERLDPARTAEAANLLDALEAQVTLAATQETGVATAGEVRANAEALEELLRELMPESWQAQSAAGDFDVILSLLDQMETAAKAGDYGIAESARLEAYAVMETGPEGRLVAFAPQLKVTLEGLFWNGQGEHPGLAALINQEASATQIAATRAELDKQLAEAQVLLGREAAPAAVATNAGLIVLREGLEAVVILASLLSSLKNGSAHLRRPLWVGTLLALLATAATWMLARGVLLALARFGEMVEAVVSLMAIGILLLITNWFFHKHYWTDWLASFHARKRQLITGAAGLWLGMLTLGFTSVFREGFETVLFLQALVFDAGSAVVLGGAAVGLAVVGLVGVLVFKLQVALPQKRLLVMTGVLIGGVLLTMVGHTVHILQVVGWLPLHPILAVPLPYWLGLWFGLYATWEGVLLQLAAAVFVIGSYVLAERQRADGRKQKTAGRPQHPKSSRRKVISEL